MTLNELKIRLGVDLEATEEDPLLALQLEDAIDYVKRRTNQEFEEGLPPSAKKAVTLLVRYERENVGNIKSEQLGDSTFVYTSKEELIKEVDDILIKARLIRMGFLK